MDCVLDLQASLYAGFQAKSRHNPPTYSSGLKTSTYTKSEI